MNLFSRKELVLVSILKYNMYSVSLLLEVTAIFDDYGREIK